MKGFLTLLVLGVAAFFGYRYYSSLPPGFGVNQSRPIGQVDDLDDYLTAKKMSSTEVSSDAAVEIFGSRFGSRPDLIFQLYGTTNEGVLVVRSQGGQLLGVGSKFKSGSREYGLGSTPQQRFTGLYWKAVTGGPPQWVDGGEKRIASLQKGRAICSWEKNVGLGASSTKDVVRFYLGKAMLRERAAGSGD